jgi:hypothetical protein
MSQGISSGCGHLKARLRLQDPPLGFLAHIAIAGRFQFSTYQLLHRAAGESSQHGSRLLPDREVKESKTEATFIL